MSCSNSMHPSCCLGDCGEEKLRVAAERDRYREALENIAQSLRLSWFTKEQARAIAKEALNGGKA